MAATPSSAASTSAPASSKYKFVSEYAINASPRLLFPYLSTAGNLAQWFCDDVKLTPDHHFNFVWDGDDHFATVTNFRLNRTIRFVFLGTAQQAGRDPNYIDFAIETSELTGEQFLRVTDYSEEHDVVELGELWEGLIHSLREIIGG